MNKKLSAALLLWCGFIGAASAAQTIVGNGIGYTARLVFDKADKQKDANSNLKTVMVKTGDLLLPGKQENSGISPQLIPAVQSNGWCYPLANPNPSGSECYGWSVYSQWYLVDLNQLSGKVWVQISVKRYDNEGDAVADQDDDLVPALTVWQGPQVQGKFGDWYPSQFQGFDDKGNPVSEGFKPFWAWTLKPLNNGATPSWATASGAGDKSVATVTQQVTLKKGDGKYLSVVVGGDDQHAERHGANFKLLVRVSAKQPTSEPGDPEAAPTPGGDRDICGCKVGVECSHPAMGHCMAKELCVGLTGAEACYCEPTSLSQCPY